MKKSLLVLLLACAMLLVIMPSVLANPQITLNCNLTCDGQNEVTKETGDIVTVTYTLENVTDPDAEYVMSSHTNEIYFNPNFLEYVEGSAKVTTGLSLDTIYQKWSDPNTRSVSFFGGEYGYKSYDSKQIIGTLDFKVIATEGSTTVYSAGLVISSDKGKYTLDTTDLVVKIGDAQVIPKHELSFETNGGTEIITIKEDEGETVDLSLYTPVRSGYSFDGWYSDSALTVKVTSILMDGDKTVYAKWTKEDSGSASTKRYTLTFETNGGSEISSVTKSKNSTIKLSTYTTEREGYTFTGWYSDEALQNQISTFNLTKNMTVYAGWEKVETSTDDTSTESSKIPSVLNGGEHLAYILGYEDGTVQPESDITRAEVATIIFRLLNEDVRNTYLTSTNDFLDVPSDQWYSTSVSTMAAMGVLKGYEGNFRPNDPITRAEFATIVARLADKSGSETAVFDDISGHWAELDILKAAALGWVYGYEGSYRPDDTITRAESMTIINRVLCRIPETTDDLLPDMKTWSDNSDTAKWYYINVQEATNSHDYKLKSDGIHEQWTKLK